eukprot:CAMPEP_0201526706 /NCGR_PEP_ID=MMETSP0161_2-20130828/32658_1 /ASSEMBLY_ACC=CAM_ASM_000251 /TAXON_ID=180227 /ORGANISM="Neoparamoeba aestuarina, Strain SoJaBio B1-5/56/2" /LENGTH=79 /DNA_ID=CAMNT_0047927201 /DNA_START=32 /DNA_END=268 /DNA_ORIENTATION=+
MKKSKTKKSRKIEHKTDQRQCYFDSRGGRCGIVKLIAYDDILMREYDCLSIWGGEEEMDNWANIIQEQWETAERAPQHN